MKIPSPENCYMMFFQPLKPEVDQLVDPKRIRMGSPASVEKI